MGLVKRLLAAYLVLTALFAAGLFMATGLIHDGSPDYPIWKVFNWFMAVGVALLLLVNVIRKWRDEGDDRNELGVALIFYGAIVLTLLFFWEWFWSLNPESETGDAVTSHLVWFPMVNSLYVVVGLNTGRYLWRGAAK